MMRGRTSKFGRAVGLVAACGALLAGCTPIVSEARVTTNETLDEQREWVAGQLDAVIAVSGQNEGWYDSFFRDHFWTEFSPEEREHFLGGIFPDKCGGGGSGRVSISLRNDSLPDGFAVAERVRELWESEGWVVTDVFADTRPGDDPDFRADREDGAQMSLQADQGGATVSVDAACSVNSTVTNWQQDRQDTSNPFAELREQREREGTEP